MSGNVFVVLLNDFLFNEIIHGSEMSNYPFMRCRNAKYRSVDLNTDLFKDETKEIFMKSAFLEEKTAEKMSSLDHQRSEIWSKRDDQNGII